MACELDSHRDLLEDLGGIYIRWIAVGSGDCRRTTSPRREVHLNTLMRDGAADAAGRVEAVWLEPEWQG